MPNFYYLFITYLITSLLIISTAHATTLDRSKLTQDQRNFLHAYTAIQDRDRPLIAQYKKKLQNYPLLPYISYLDYLKNLNNTPTIAIVNFIKSHKNTHLANRLTLRWLNHLGKTKQWSLFLEHYDSNKHTSSNLSCYYVQAHIHKSKSYYNLGSLRDHWVTGRPLSKACQPIDTYIRNNQKLTGSMLWDNIILAVKKRQISFATLLSQDLSKKERGFYQAWLKIDKNPKLLAKGFPKDMPLRVKQAAFKQSIILLARKDPLLANQLLKKYAKPYNISLINVNELRRTISLRLAYRYKTEAKQFLYEVNQTEASKDTLRWQLQVALKNSDWLTILETYELLDPEYQIKNKWQYWKARALNETNKQDQAKIIFKDLAKKRNFYGFLSADILNLDYQFNPTSNDDIDIDYLLKKYSQLPRIKELIAINWKINANREWYHLLTHVKPDDLEAVNYLALEWEQYNIAIRGAAKAKDWNNINLRFPTPHKGPIMKAASQNEIDPAWIYAVMRRESAFAKNTLSPAGAIGLMQLMPKTAKYIGQKMGVNASIYRDLTNPKSNIKLGSAYLSYLYKKYDYNRIKATAAYNAGPSRVNQWIPKDRVIEADQWIDSIPFTETRRYVKAVMEYTIIFQSLLNQKYDRLEINMQPIGVLKNPK